MTKTIWQPDELTDSSICSFEDLVAWSSSYFDFWHPAYPCLHAPSVLENFEALATGRTLDIWQMIMIKSILSISLADGRQSGTLCAIPKQLVFETFDEALENVLPAVMKPATLPGLQAALTVQLFLVSMLRLNAASRIGGLIVRMAYQLGLHRCPARFPGFTEQERSQRRRLFECIYCLERHVSHALGLPLTIRDDDIDVCHFDAELHSQESASLDDRLALLTFLTKLARIRGSIMELRNKNIDHRDSESDAPMLLNTHLKRWWNEVDDFLDNMGSDQSISRLHRAVIEVLRHESIIILNRPLLALPKSNAKYGLGLQSCISASKAIISVLWSLVQLPKGTCPLTWPSFTWATWMSSFIIVYGALGGHISHEVSLKAIDRAGAILQELADRGSVWPSACALAIGNLRTALGSQSTASTAFIKSLGFAVPQTHATRSAVAGVQQTQYPLHPFVDTAHATPDSSWPPPSTSSSSHRKPPSADGASIRSSTQNDRHHDNLSETQPQRTPLPGVAPHAPAPTPTPAADFDPQHQWWPNPVVLPKDIPPYSFDFTDPLQGFDIPFWVGQDNYVSWSGPANSNMPP